MATWTSVAVQTLRGRLVYDVADASGKTKRLVDDQVLHLRDRTDDGMVGRSRLSKASDVVKLAIHMQNFGNYFFDNSARPGGLLSAPGLIGAETAERLQSYWQDAFGGRRNGGIAVMGDGLKFEKMSFSPEESEMTDGKRFATEEIARVFNVPPPLISDYTHNTFTNSQQAARWFATNTLTPWITKLEHQILRAVFSQEDRQSHSIEFDLSGFLRGDAETRWNTHKIAIENSILTRDEIREIESYPPLGHPDEPDNPPASFDIKSLRP